MRLPAFLSGVPRIAIVLAVPAVVFLLAVGVKLGASSGSEPAPPPTLAVSVSTPRPTPAVAAALASTPTPQPSRTDCNAIRGTDYRSEDERAFFQKNCSTTSGGTTVGASTAARTTTTNTTTTTSAQPAAPAVSKNQTALGDRLVVSSVGINADVWSAYVDAGYMPDPVGYDNVVWYDFSSMPGFGGYANSGNLVLAGHVDCGRCRNGGSGTAVFWSVRGLKAGDTAQYVLKDGKTVNYVVTASQDVNTDTDWASIVSSKFADMTLITCTGTFDAGAHEYNLRHYVALKKV